ncbi:uncharacterized protein LOC101448283 [Ceratitis capitata]|nr:uncharacterized protein LOC101448283 [Ceratitis capitata]
MAATTPAVFITVPKYVAITHNPTMTLPKIRPAPTPTSLQSTNTIGANSDAFIEDGATAPRGKKRRLDHLTWEEKIQRKKLKNRVAAQTSRDRKKARMEDMEHEIEDLTQKTEILQNKCESLQAINESLLEKNHKLDMEVELLRQKLDEVQQKQKKQEEQLASNAAKLKAKNTVETCAGSAAGINPNGLSVDRRTTEKEQLSGVTVEDYCTLPTLQDMLLVDEEFDASKLEELAESLLADITADMEAGNGAGNENDAKIAGIAERLSGSMVGTKTECLESGKHTNAQSINLNKRKWPSDDKLQSKLPAAIDELITTNTLPVPSTPITIASATTMPTITTDNEIYSMEEGQLNEEIETSTPPDMLYGTYDAKTNSITIVVDDDAVPVNEAVEEIYCEGVMPQTCDEIKYPTPAASPSQVFLNVVDDSDDDLDFDPIERFLQPKQPLSKSPAPSLHSATSDHGYESIIGSPTSAATEQFDTSAEDFGWHGSFNDLFPNLI